MASASFTAVGKGADILVDSGSTITYSLSGTFAGTLQLVSSTDGGNSWRILLQRTTATSGSYILDTPAGQRSLVCWRCTAYTSGTAVTSYSAEDPISESEQGVVDSLGDAADMPGDQVIESLQIGLKKFYVAASTVPGYRAYRYGCDGVADQVQINAALVAAGVSGGIVELSDGVFNTSSNIASYASNVFIKGQGKGLTIIRPAVGWASNITPGGYTIGAAVAFVSGAAANLSNFGIVGVTVDKLTNNISCNGIVAISDNGDSTYYCDNGIIKENTVLGNGGPQYEIWTYRGKNIDIFNNYVDGGTTTYTAGDQQGIEVYGGENVRIFSNTVKNVRNVGILIQCISETPNSHCKRIHVFDNDIDTAGQAIQWASHYAVTNGAMDLMNIHIHDNTARNIFQYGLHGNHGTGNSSTPPKLYNINVHDNSVYMATTGGDTTPSGLYLRGDTATNRHEVYGYKVHHNEIFNVSPTLATGSVVSMNLATFLSGVEITDNSFITPIALLQATANSFYKGFLINTCSDIKFNRNKIDGCNDQALSLQTVTGFEIKDNDLRNWNNYNSGASGFSGINFDGGTSTTGVVSGNRGQPCSVGIANVNAIVSTAGATAVNEVDFINNGHISQTFANGLLYNLGSNTANCNLGTFTVSASATHTLANERIKDQSLILLQNETGTAYVITTNPANAGSADITFSASNSDTWRYRIIN